MRAPDAAYDAAVDAENLAAFRLASLVSMLADQLPPGPRWTQVADDIARFQTAKDRRVRAGADMAGAGL